MSERDRYVIGRDGVFATLYDTVERRLIVENATRAFCEQVREDLLAGRGHDPTNGAAFPARMSE